MDGPDPAPLAWTPALVERLRELWATPATALEIGQALGITRGAVAGKACRLGLPARPRRQPEPKPKPKPKPKSRKPAADAPANPVPPPLLAPELPVPPPDPPLQGVRFTDLTSRHCRWIDGKADGPQTLYCGEQVESGLPWCAQHAKRAYSVGTWPSRRFPSKTGTTG